MNAGTLADLIGGVGGGLVIILAVIVGLRRLFGAKPAVCPVNAGDALTHLADAIDNISGAIREQTSLLREIRDKLIGMGYEQQQAVIAVGRVESSMQALHRRFDGIAGPRE